MPTTLRQSVNPIISAMVTQLVTFTGLPVERILLSSWEKIPSFQADQDVVLHIGRPVPEGRMEATGRFWSYLRRMVAVRVRSRLQFDMAYQDLSRLTDTSLGLFVLEESVLDALQDFQPVDTMGNSLVIEPIRYYEEGPDPTPDPTNSIWISSVLPFSILYTLNFNQARQ